MDLDLLKPHSKYFVQSGSDLFSFNTYKKYKKPNTQYSQYLDAHYDIEVTHVFKGSNAIQLGVGGLSIDRLTLAPYITYPSGPNINGSLMYFFEGPFYVFENKNPRDINRFLISTVFK